MKISIPWPSRKNIQLRIKETISLWDNKEDLLICLPEPCEDKFLKNHNTALMPKNSTSIGTEHPKCFIYDMVNEARKNFKNENWYGFGNSDVVPVGNLTEDLKDFEVLVYHRTEIFEWEDRHQAKLSEYKKIISHELFDMIIDLRSSGNSDKRIAKKLNLEGFPPPENENEWHYKCIQDIFKIQGEIFFWGQDMFLFREDVVDKVLENYLSIKNPILGTGGYDPRISRYLMENFKGVRVLNRIFHKKHESEWFSDEIEYIHNGGHLEAPISKYYDHNYIIQTYEDGYKPVLSKYAIGILPKTLRTYERKNIN